MCHLIEIIRIENKLRPSFVQSFALSTFPPRGRLGVRQNFMEARGSLDVRKGFPFLPKKMKFAEFFFRQEGKPYIKLK